MKREEDLLRPPEKGIRPEHRRLFGDYVRFLDAAADAGRTAPRGLTPREHLGRLLESGGLPGDDLRLLTDRIETLIYGEADEDPAEAIAVCARLAAMLPDLPPVPAPPRRTRRPLLRSLSRFWFGLGVGARNTFLGLLLAVAIVVSEVPGPASCSPVKGPGATTTGPGLYRGRHRSGRIENHPGWDGREEEAVRRAHGGWEKAEEAPTFVDVVVPRTLRPSSPATGPGLDTVTGVDHNFIDWRDPMTPPMGAHHRIDVYTRVDAAYRFGRESGPLRPATATPGSGAVSHRADVRVHLRAGAPVPIPSSAPDARVTGWRWEDPVVVRFVLDPGDGLAAIADRDVTTHLVYDLESGGGYLDADLPATPWAEVALTPMPIAENVRRDALVVIAHIGGLPAATYEDTVRRLQAYFSSFSVAPLAPDEERESPLLTLALARKGVCRHRSRCFVMVANALGIPARLVENEIHSFAEVELPDGRWRALEFRLFDVPERAPWDIVDDREPQSVSSIVALILILVSFTGLVWFREQDEKRSHRLVPERRPSRSERRSLRDADAERADHSVSALAALARRRLGERLGVSGEDPVEVQDALDRIGAPHLLQAQARVVSDPAWREAEAKESDRYALSEIYWSARGVIRWAREDVR